MLWKSKTGGLRVTEKSHHLAFSFPVPFLFIISSNFVFSFFISFYSLSFFFLHLYIQLLYSLIFTLNLSVSLFFSYCLLKNNLTFILVLLLIVEVQSGRRIGGSKPLEKKYECFQMSRFSSLSCNNEQFLPNS